MIKFILKIKHDICLLLATLFYTSSRRELQRYKRRLQRSVQNHWKEHEILMKDLVYEDWEDDRNSGSLGREEISPKRDLPKSDKENKNFIVFIDQELKIDWIAEFEIGTEIIKNISYAMTIEAQPNDHLRKNHRLSFKRLIGEAVVAALKDSPDNSKSLSAKAQNFLSYRTTERSRQWSLEFATVMIAPFIIIALICISMYGQEDGYTFFLLLVFWGVIGAYLSIVRRVGQQKLDASSGRWIHFLEISSKIIAGGLFGTIIYIILHTSLCPTIFSGFQNDIYMVSLAGFISGFCERFVPDMIAVYNNKTS